MGFRGAERGFLPGTSAALRGMGAFAERDGLLLGESVCRGHQKALHFGIAREMVELNPCTPCTQLERPGSTAARPRPHGSPGSSGPARCSTPRRPAPSPAARRTSPLPRRATPATHPGRSRSPNIRSVATTNWCSRVHGRLRVVALLETLAALRRVPPERHPRTARRTPSDPVRPPSRSRGAPSGPPATTHVRNSRSGPACRGGMSSTSDPSVCVSPRIVDQFSAAQTPSGPSRHNLR